MRPQKLRKGSEPMRILFMGTPDFAVASLRRLVADGHEVCGVFTQPDKPKNRGHKLMPTPVKEYALTQNIPGLPASEDAGRRRPWRWCRSWHRS